MLAHCYRRICALVTLLPGVVLAGSSPPLNPGESFHFAHDISPILAKVGCSAAECHGGATGQGGFKLSLFAENPELDYESIVRELDGRRLDFLRPAHSLLLRKPTRQGVKHKGGRLLHPSDRLYQVLHDWIEAGAPFQSGPSEALQGISVSYHEDRCQVIAEFAGEDGVVQRDVTHLAQLESKNEQVAFVDDDGRVKKMGAGETWLLARYGKYSSRIAYRAAFERTTEHAVVSEHPLDRAWGRRLQELGLSPAPQADVYTLGRRLYFDLTGRPPDPYELDRFVALPPETRVKETARELVKRQEFDQVFGRAIAGFFEIPVAGKDPRNAKQRNDRLREFFADTVSEGASLSEIAHGVLSDPTGKTAWQHFADPRDRAEYVGRTLLGMRIGCARCHNHPLDRWTNAEHLAFSAFFTDPRPGPGGMMMAGKFFLPGAGTAVEPELLPVSQRQPARELASDRRVEWLVLEGAKEQFARNMGNRLFGLLMGRGLVELPDDHRLTNPATHVDMLDTLADQLIRVEGDLRAFVEFLVTSQLYAVSSAPPDAAAVSGDPELQYFARREARSLTSEQLKEAAEFVLGVSIPADTPPDSPLARQLYVLNSGMFQRGLEEAGNQVEAILLFETETEKQLESLFRLILSRSPRAAEKDTFLPVIKAAAEPETAFRNLAFALLASREFGSVR